MDFFASGVFINPDSVLARTAREMIAAHGGSGQTGDDGVCPLCGDPLPCATAAGAAEVVAAAGMGQLSGLHLLSPAASSLVRAVVPAYDPARRDRPLVGRGSTAESMQPLVTVPVVFLPGAARSAAPHPVNTAATGSGAFAAVTPGVVPADPEREAYERGIRDVERQHPGWSDSAPATGPRHRWSPERSSTPVPLEPPPSATARRRSRGHRVAGRQPARRPTGQVAVAGLADSAIDIGLGVLTVITGATGRPVRQVLAQRGDMVVLDQSTVRGSRRSNPATYTGLWDPVRAAFAKANRVKPALFSTNSEGGCPNCKGMGSVPAARGSDDDGPTVCRTCKGRRFTAQVLKYKLRGRTIGEVLAMSVVEAAEFVTEEPAALVLDRLVGVGLSDLGLGQSLTTLSGSERQRLDLVVHLAEPQTRFVLDRPTAGLSSADAARLPAMLDGIVDAGHTVIVLDDDPLWVPHADSIIEVTLPTGPTAGRRQTARHLRHHARP